MLTEGLDYHDLKGQISPFVTVDEYSAKIGDDSDIVTLSFKLNSKLAANDLVTFLERGYDFVLDADVSDGAIEPGKYLVFVELDRRTSVPKRIIQILEDLETLTDMAPSKYKIRINDEEYAADEEVLKQHIILSPSEYKKVKENEAELNEMREIAGIQTKVLYESDTQIKNLKAIAGL